MTKIQIVFVFAAVDELPAGMARQAEQIVREEYARTFNCPPGEITTTLFNGTANNLETDIHLYISTDQKYYNTGKLRLEMKQAVSKRLLLLFPGYLGFSGRLTCAEGEMNPAVIKPAAEPALAAAPGAEKKNAAPAEAAPGEGEMDYSERAKMYPAQNPRFGFEILQLPEETINRIDKALARIRMEREIFQDWGLYAIMPNPTCAMSFFGPPGTGKSLAAEAIASKLEKKIIRISYADIESKYVGEGPKNVSAAFLAAEQQDAILFIDEADSMLSKRLTNVNQGSEQAINSMRSQMLICLERFHGIVIFATNLVVNYDKAFLSRLINIPFELPDAGMRKKIWESHLLPREGNGVMLNIPLAADVDTQKLADEYEMCGREIRNAVVNACVQAKLSGEAEVNQQHLSDAAREELESSKEAVNAEDHTATDRKINVPPAVKSMMVKLANEKESISADELEGPAE